MLQDRADKICEMANVMQKSIQIDEDSVAKEQELMSRLITENKVCKEDFDELLLSLRLMLVLGTPRNAGDFQS